MIAIFVKMHDVAFDRGRRVADYRASVLAHAVSVIAEFAVDWIDVFEEREREIFLSRSEHRQRELLRLLYQLMRGRIGLDSHYDQRGSEARLGRPVNRRDGLFIAVLGAEYLQPVGDHSQPFFLRILVHIREPPILSG